MPANIMVAGMARSYIRRMFSVFKVHEFFEAMCCSRRSGSVLSAMGVYTRSHPFVS